MVYPCLVLAQMFWFASWIIYISFPFKIFAIEVIKLHSTRYLNYNFFFFQYLVYVYVFLCFAFHKVCVFFFGGKVADSYNCLGLTDAAARRLRSTMTETKTLSFYTNLLISLSCHILPYLWRIRRRLKRRLRRRSQDISYNFYFAKKETVKETKRNVTKRNINTNFILK